MYFAWNMKKKKEKSKRIYFDQSYINTDLKHLQHVCAKNKK